MVAYNYLPPATQEIKIARESIEKMPLGTDTPLFVASSQDEEPIELPAGAAAVLRDVMQIIAAGHGLTVVPLHSELTTKQAADILNVSRPYLIKLLDAGEIPFHKVGSHRRIRTEDVMRYQQTLRDQQEVILDQMVAEAQEMGLYD